MLVLIFPLLPPGHIGAPNEEETPLRPYQKAKLSSACQQLEDVSTISGRKDHQSSKLMNFPAYELFMKNNAEGRMI